MNLTTKAAPVFFAGGLFVLLCSAWYVDKTVVNVIPSLPVPADFNAYYNAAQNIAAGHSPFNARSYIYPPLLAFALAPAARLSYLTVRWIWFLFSQLCLLTAAWLTWRSIGRDWTAACTVAFIWAVGGAAEESLGLGQPGPELTLLMAIAITQPVTERAWRAAVAIGTGVAIKLFPGVLAVWFILRRQWRALAVFTGTVVVLVLLPWSLVVCCLDGPRTPGDRDTWAGTPSALSWGIPSVVLRAMDPPAPGGPLPRDWETDIPYLRLPQSHRWAAIGAAAFTLVGGVTVLMAALRRKTSSDISESDIPDPFGMAALVSLALAASPVCWTHYQMLQYPGVALLLCHASRARRWGLLAAALALGALLYPLPVAVLTEYYMKYGKWTASLPTFYFWDSIAPFASLGLFGLSVREIGRQPLPYD
jgi:hypothetical protein